MLSLLVDYVKFIKYSLVSFHFEVKSEVSIEVEI